METRGRIALALLTFYGVVFTVFGFFADTLFPSFGWAHNPGLGGAQILMRVGGIGTLILVAFLSRDWEGIL